MVATTTAALLLATLLPGAPAFADDVEPPTSVASITGTVTDPAGAAAGDLCITVETFDGTAWSPVQLTPEVRTDAAGAYTVTALADGTYAVGADACTPPSDTLRTWAPSLSAQPEILDGVVVTGGVAAAPVDIRLLPAAVAAIADPTIAGIAAIGSTLTADPGGWNVSGLAFGYQWNRGGVAIADATAATYTPVPEDAGSALTVSVTATRQGWTSATTSSAATAPVAAGALATTTPVIVGTAKVGSPFTVSPNWTPGTTYTYVWKRSGSNAAVSTGSSYTPTSADLGATFTVTVTGTLAGYTGVTLTSAPTAAVTTGSFGSAPNPTVTGQVAVGQTVTAAPGVWSPAPALSYQWRRNGIAIAGATAATYAIAPTDLGTALSVTVSGRLTSYTTANRTSLPITVVRGTLTAPAPKIWGTRAVGGTLGFTAGTWGPAPVKLAFQWLRDGAPIAGATGTTYVLTPSDRDTSIAIRVTGTKTAYNQLVLTSAGTSKIARGTLTAGTPKLSGSRAVGGTLAVSAGAWGPAPVKLAYQWLRNGVAIAGANGATYAVTTADFGTSISATVTGTKTGYNQVAVTTAGTSKIAAGTIIASPTISGLQRSGSKLTVNLGKYWPSTATATYQWYRLGSRIGGQTASTYTLGNIDAGKLLSVVVTFTKANYTTLRVTVNTGKIAPRPASLGGDGVYRVGIDIQPGTYFTSATNTADCRWWRLSDLSGSESSVYGGDAGSGRRMMTILADDSYVVTSNCGSWVRFDGTGYVSWTMPGDGIAHVGSMVRPGAYVSYGNDYCYVAALNAPTGMVSDIYENTESYDSTVYWYVYEGEYFEAYGCNEFTWYSN
ncbi:carboxypeptidase-like regulatory domain-containing protein [Agromyces allii]|uniref:Alpha-amylase n=1 Tax=Agromyces allii TaxID=393607 RepID=A0ABN2QQN1_9MICO|nr:carboxypeptidase-like regulatory domain-containing protein [Agromyces allii]